VHAFIYFSLYLVGLKMALIISQNMEPCTLNNILIPRKFVVFIDGFRIKSGNLTSWNLLGHSRPVMGLLYLYLYLYLDSTSS
jgi:hypothetical protein